MPVTDAHREAADWTLLDEVLKEQRPRLLELARKRFPPTLRGRLDPEDILSELSLRARKRWASFQTARAARGAEARPYDLWLAGLVKECIIDAYRHHTAQKCDVHQDVPFPDGSASQLLLGIFGPGTSPSEAFARAEMEERLARVLALLKASDQELLRLRYCEGWAWADVAAVLGLSEGNANVKHTRALRRLRDLWKQLYGLEGMQS